MVAFCLKAINVDNKVILKQYHFLTTLNTTESTKIFSVIISQIYQIKLNHTKYICLWYGQLVTVEKCECVQHVWQKIIIEYSYVAQSNLLFLGDNFVNHFCHPLFVTRTLAIKVKYMSTLPIQVHKPKGVQKWLHCTLKLVISYYYSVCKNGSGTDFGIPSHST